MNKGNLDYAEFDRECHPVRTILKFRQDEQWVTEPFELLVPTEHEKRKTCAATFLCDSFKYRGGLHPRSSGIALHILYVVPTA